MSVTITSKKYWKKLARRARDKALEAADYARAGAAAAEEKAEELRGRLRLEREIRDLQEEIDLQMQAVGEVIYASHQGCPSDSDCVQEILEYVDGLYEQMEAHQRELLLARGVLVCSACGAANESGHVYCCDCGRPLARR